jgi:hypothetical protein
MTALAAHDLEGPKAQAGGPGYRLPPGPPVPSPLQGALATAVLLGVSGRYFRPGKRGLAVVRERL